MSAPLANATLPLGKYTMAPINVIWNDIRILYQDRNPDHPQDVP